jgi:hypothetical protein
MWLLLVTNDVAEYGCFQSQRMLPRHLLPTLIVTDAAVDKPVGSNVLGGWWEGHLKFFPEIVVLGA